MLVIFDCDGVLVDTEWINRHALIFGSSRHRNRSNGRGSGRTSPRALKPGNRGQGQGALGNTTRGSLHTRPRVGGIGACPALRSAHRRGWGCSVGDRQSRLRDMRCFERYASSDARASYVRGPNRPVRRPVVQRGASRSREAVSRPVPSRGRIYGTRPQFVHCCRG